MKLNLCCELHSKSQFGEGHPNTLKTMSSYASVLFGLKRYAEAEVLERRVVAAFRARKGQHHGYFTAQSNLAGTLQAQGKLDEAEQLFRRSLTAKQKKFGAGHFYCLLTLFNLGLVQTQQDKLTEAEKTLQQAKDGFLTAYGATHPHTMMATKALARALLKQGKLQEAMKLGQQFSGD